MWVGENLGQVKRSFALFPPLLRDLNIQPVQAAVLELPSSSLARLSQVFFSTVLFTQ